jgi:hypothetical protein
MWRLIFPEFLQHVVQDRPHLLNGCDKFLRCHAEFFSPFPDRMRLVNIDVRATIRLFRFHGLRLGEVLVSVGTVKEPYVVGGITAGLATK